MAKLTKSEWFLFLLNLAIAAFILIAVIWALLPQSNNCWSDTATETQNLTQCEGR